MKKITFLALFLSVGIINSWSQCSIYGTSQPGVVLNGPTMNGSGIAVAYSNSLDYYYSVSGGGSSMNIITYDNAGTEISAGLNTTIDHRGLWWNANQNQLETNGFSSGGVSSMDLDGSNYALNTSVLLNAGNQPDGQSTGKYDYDNDEIIYYFNGRIYRVDYATGASISDYAITGLPVAMSNLNTYFVGYTGCVGQEIIVFDVVLGAVYYIDKATGAYAATTLMSAVSPANWFDVSYANNQIFYRTASIWTGHYIMPLCSNSPSAFSVDVCETYTVPSGDETYVISGIYNDTIPNATGCDSIMTITVNVTTLDLNTSTTDFTMTADFGGGTYQWINCSDDSPIAGETNQSFTADANGDYAVIITDGSCSDTSDCVTIAGVGINELNQTGISIFPNPNNGEFYISTSVSDASVTIYAIDGKVVMSNLKLTQANNQQVNLGDIENGIYIVEVTSNSNKETIRLIIE